MLDLCVYGRGGKDKSFSDTQLILKLRDISQGINSTIQMTQNILKLYNNKIISIFSSIKVLYRPYIHFVNNSSPVKSTLYNMLLVEFKQAFDNIDRDMMWTTTALPKYNFQSVTSKSDCTALTT